MGMYNPANNQCLSTEKNLGHREEDIKGKSLERAGYILFYGGGAMFVSSFVLYFGFGFDKESSVVVGAAGGLSAFVGMGCCAIVELKERIEEEMTSGINDGTVVPVDDLVEGLEGNYSVKVLRDFLDGSRKSGHIIKFNGNHYIQKEFIPDFLSEVKKEALTLRCEKNVEQNKFVKLDDLFELTGILEHLKVETKRGTYTRTEDFERVLGQVSKKYNSGSDSLRRISGGDE